MMKDSGSEGLPCLCVFDIDRTLTGRQEKSLSVMVGEMVTISSTLSPLKHVPPTRPQPQGTRPPPSWGWGDGVGPGGEKMLK